MIANFMFWLRRSKNFSVSAVLGYRCMLAAVFRVNRPDISSASVLKVFIRLFPVETPTRTVRPPSWDLNMVMTYFTFPRFEPLDQSSLRYLTKKVLFLISLAMAE